jgi:hypothetical protein
LRVLGADYVPYSPWLPYPKLGVAELEPPAGGKTMFRTAKPVEYPEDPDQVTWRYAGSRTARSDAEGARRL